MILKNHGTMAKTDEVEGLADSVSWSSGSNPWQRDKHTHTLSISIHGDFSGKIICNRWFSLIFQCYVWLPERTYDSSALRFVHHATCECLAIILSNSPEKALTSAKVAWPLVPECVSFFEYILLLGGLEHV
jgi:hypothetical protein